MKFKSKLLLISFLLFQAVLLAQNNITISGTVTDDMGQPLPGASVVLQGTTTGIQTDFDGNYRLENIPSNGTLVFSYVGFTTQTIPINNRTTIDLTMEADTQSLDEVVVVGYGTQKKADLTGSIVTVDAEQIEKTPSANPVQALQGKVAGVQIVSPGSPGASPTVRIRGLGTYSDATSLLYVVDGMFYSNIDFLNPNDIKSMNVLKDASSSAIYGVRAANGVIIIETKSGGKNRKPQIEYNGYTGIQRAQNVLQMANAEQFVTMAVESGSAADVQFILNAMQRYGRSRINPNVPDVNTDWYDEIIRDGVIQNHSLSVTGGTDNVSYSMGANYFSQEGLLDMKNDYERFNIRSKLDIDVLDNLKMGVNTVFSNATQQTPENSAWFKAYFAVPILPVFDAMNTEATPTQYANAQALGYRGTQNPFPDMDYNDNRLKIRKLLANIYLQTDIIKDKLTFKTTYNVDFSALEERYVNLPYNMGYGDQRISSINRRQNNYFNQIWDNVLTYTDTFDEDHNVTVMAGTSFRDEAANQFQATGSDIAGIDYETSWYLNFADPLSFNNNVEENNRRIYGQSYFGRINYNYKNRYLLYGTFRADRSSKFTKEQWGYFPSIGAGWVVSEEPFMENVGFFDFLKLRAAWGRLGNDNVPASSGTNTISNQTVDLGDTPNTGITATSTFTDLTWEVVEELDFGFNMNTLNNRLSVEADYYIRDTEDAIMPVYIPIANQTVSRNSGVIRNSGVEVALNWSDEISPDFTYTIGANFTTVKNEAIEIEDESGYIDSGSAEFRQRTMVGEPLYAFYGYETTGVYQNQAQIDADPVAQSAIADGQDIQPGYLIFNDRNGDGAITDEDRMVIGSFLPKFTYGGNIGLNYKDFGFSMNFYGQTGNKILNRKRGEVIFTNDTNMDADLAKNRWHGEGTSNSYPSSAGLRDSWNQRLSNFWVEDGAFFRIQNIQLAYTLRGDKLKGNAPDFKFTLTAERPLTLFNYNGFNPEVSDGVDRQTYPVPAIYTIGVNVKL
ncbi:SusC/RagA family TonB-linked outer membrane protein [Flagellimonas zhangzhouensis]|uniref:TonB-linked outer membrane protein, SusC/RagA family n=1 Tax=Flagellimonas zhangzhouensis TaxID=1073328 RepID=A0A1H2RHB3_9FLAO|nr:TonB-dependent receptor [Allomuricauda zhangzhouensis]SDQ63805.1 TonB-linked outer membrane protein, SusC/RagA family [Allomuricauda zhangzhouensis]SDW18777.1 TonB-linked outer membrane protein, SusC/RagA family [Allomuricauda zhangzhouensis]